MVWSRQGGAAFINVSSVNGQKGRRGSSFAVLLKGMKAHEQAVNSSDVASSERRARDECFSKGVDRPAKRKERKCATFR